MTVQAIHDALIGVGITHYTLYGDSITNETEYKASVRQIVGISTTIEGDGLPRPVYRNEPSVDWNTFNTKLTETTNGEPMKALREYRNRRLTETDWTQNPDVPAETRNKWTAYRQALRDLPATATPRLAEDNESLDLHSVSWPTKPT